jgi:hypothetical protein
MATGAAICLGAIGYAFSHQPPIAPAVVPTDIVMIKPEPSLPPAASPVPTPAPASAQSRPQPRGKKVLKAYANPRDGLITNEYAHFSPNDPAAVKSPDWKMTSGSLFGRGGAYWTGKPDSCEPDAKSSRCTNSNVFRLDSKQAFAGNIRVNLALMQLANISDRNCNSDDTCWHGTHVWLRYQSQYNLYYASVNRADSQVVIKRKVPCGSDNDGTYFVLGSYAPGDFKPNAWKNYSITVQTNADKSVTIKLYDLARSSTRPMVAGIDRGGTNPNWSAGCKTPGKYPSARYAPITAAGGVGIRGDYANFVFKDLVVTQL